MITLLFYLIWIFFLEKDDEAALMAVPLSIADGIMIYMILFEIIN